MDKLTVDQHKAKRLHDTAKHAENEQAIQKLIAEINAARLQVLQLQRQNEALVKDGFVCVSSDDWSRLNGEELALRIAES